MVTICENLITLSFESCDLLGTILKQRRQFLRIYDTPLPHPGSFLFSTIRRQFLTPLPYQLFADVVYGWPKII